VRTRDAHRRDAGGTVDGVKEAIDAGSSAVAVPTGDAAMALDAEMLDGDDIDVDLLAGELLDVVNRLRRTTRRVVRRRIHEHALAPAEIEVLVAVIERPKCGVRDVAHVLGLAANTVRTLVGTLVHEGLLARTEDPNDRRVAVLRPTPAGRARVRRWRDERREVVADALADLGPDQLARLRHGLEPMRAVAGSLYDVGEEQFW
jgi:DNA-binding MarR family transcriptional regulator